MNVEFKMGVREDGDNMTDAFEIDEIFVVEIDEETFPISKADMLCEASVNANGEASDEIDEAIVDLMTIIATNRDLLKEMYQRLHGSVTRYVEKANIEYFELTITQLSINGKAILPDLPFDGDYTVFLFSCVYGEYDPDGSACSSYF